MMITTGKQLSYFHGLLVEPFFADRLDLHLAELIRRLDPGAPDSLLVAVMVLSARTREGHVCLDLGTGTSLWQKVRRITGLEEDEHALLRTAKASPVVGTPGEGTPLVLRGKRLYLRRYDAAEQMVANAFYQRAMATSGSLDPVSSLLAKYFPALPECVVTDDAAEWGRGTGTETADMQKVAAFVAATKSLCVISGGPGTGKTTTVLKILAILLEQDPGAEIVLTAPTGKAAARLSESIRNGKAKMTPGAILEEIPETAVTLHRFLGAGGGGRFSHNRENPVTADIVIVDEASMVDLLLMAKLVDALRPATRLILLGDRFQLASVAPGAVLGELCGGGAAGQFTPDFAAMMEAGTGCHVAGSAVDSDGLPIADCVVELTKSYRFQADSGIGRLAFALNRGDGDAAVRALRSEEQKDLFWLGKETAFRQEMAAWIRRGYGRYGKKEDPATAFAAFSAFRILCVLREGPLGVGAMNALAEEVLSRAGMIRPDTPWYTGRPVMVTENDYRTGLFNGDIGLVLPDPESGENRVFFEGEEQTFRKFHPLRLPAVETVFAMTVHKSQGSEFDTVLVVLPDREAPILTREILYTAVTRARRQVAVAGEEAILISAADRVVERASGLREAIRKADLPHLPPVCSGTISGMEQEKCGTDRQHDSGSTEEGSL